MNYLAPTYFLDFESPEIQEFIAPYQDPSMTIKEKVIALYLDVRDNWRYDPYFESISDEHFRASVIASKTTGNCVDKSILLIAGLRGLGIPARLHLGKVKNHIAVERLVEKFGSNEMTPHGMVSVFLNGKWLKMSPAFNKTLCERFNVEPLDFDGENHSFLQQYNSEGSLFMEYIDDYGFFDDIPVEFMQQNVREHYPHIFDNEGNLTEFGQ